MQGLVSEEIWLDLTVTEKEFAQLVHLLREKLKGSKSIALVGFMACGKSTIGKFLAQELGFSFIDTDSVAEALDGRPIPRIFEEEGEAVFRKIETEALKSVCEHPCAVIATGGGIVETPENLEILRKNCYVVFLDIPFDVMAERASTNDNRPLFRNREKAYELWQKRCALYREVADIVYDSHDELVSKSVRHIAENYHTTIKKSR